eukprot:5593828-Pyramimonas_sp.AAC.1
MEGRPRSWAVLGSLGGDPQRRAGRLRMAEIDSPRPATMGRWRRRERQADQGLSDDEGPSGLPPLPARARRAARHSRLSALSGKLAQRE